VEQRVGKQVAFLPTAYPNEERKSSPKGVNELA